jgi:hypothetical protein
MPEHRNPIAVQFGRNLARIRKQAGHPQEALAARKGQSEQSDAAALIREVRDEMEER